MEIFSAISCARAVNGRPLNGFRAVGPVGGPVDGLCITADPLWKWPESDHRSINTYLDPAATTEGSRAGAQAHEMADRAATEAARVQEHGHSSPPPELAGEAPVPFFCPQGSASDPVKNPPRRSALSGEVDP